MNETEIDAWLSIPGLIFGVFSIIGNCYVFFSTNVVMEYLVPHSNDDVIVRLIHWLAFIDFWWVISFSMNLIPTGFNLNTYSSTMCVFLGICLTFISVVNNLWHLLIASDFFYLLNKTSKRNFFFHKFSGSSTHKKYYYLQNPTTYSRLCYLVILLSFLTAILPPIFDTQRNARTYANFHNYYDNNGDGYGSECWLVSDWRLMIYIPTIIGLLFHYLVLLFSILKYRQTKSFTNAYMYLIKRLIPWIICYSVIKIFPTIFRIWGLVGNVEDIPLWFVVIHHVCITGCGVANGTVWYFTRKVDPSKAQLQLQSGTMSGSSNQLQMEMMQPMNDDFNDDFNDDIRDRNINARMIDESTRISMNDVSTIMNQVHTA